MILQKYEDYLTWPNLFGEDAEHGGTAAGHAGIEGTSAVHLLFQCRNGRVGGKYGCLKVVDYQVAPLLDGAADGFAEVWTWAAEKVALQTGVCLLGAHMLSLVNLYYNLPLSTFHFPLDGFQLVADARGVGGAVADEEGAVGSQSCGTLLQPTVF